eukprot:5685372-Lingulodinium_polyedra.AAC.1
MKMRREPMMMATVYWTVSLWALAAGACDNLFNASNVNLDCGLTTLDLPPAAIEATSLAVVEDAKPSFAGEAMRERVAVR